MDTNKHRAIFFPNAERAKLRAEHTENRFAYYTTAEVAYQIIKNKQIWMRNTTTMNDYMEVEYGQRLLLGSRNSPAWASLKEAIEKHHPGLFDESWNLLTAWLPGFRFDTFITCVSEHDPSENDFGRLSMWRAYGGKTGVALVIDGAAFSLESTTLGAYSSPVSYLTQDQFIASIAEVAENIGSDPEYINSISTNVLKNTLFNMFRFAVLATKHPGFAEERELRIIASPIMFPDALLKPEFAVVNGVPQPILKISLEENPEHGLIGLAIPSLLKRVIIGPCAFPRVTYRALWEVLEGAGVEDPSRILTESEIPLRHS
ncbi:Protein of unknown function DUF2971 [Comamonadaceae bacterium]